MPVRASACVLALCTLFSVGALAPTVHAEGVPVEQASEEQKAKARDAFTEARKAFDERRFLEALKGFNASYDIVASPNTQLMIGHTERELGRDSDAYRTFEQVAEQAEAAMASDPKYQKTAQIAREELDKLKGSVGMLTIEVSGADDAATLTVAGKPLDRARWGKPVAVPPGKVSVVLSSGGKNQASEADVAAGASETLRIAPASDTAPQPRPDPVPDTSDDDGGVDWRLVTGIAVGAAGVASFVVAGVLGGLALDKHNELEDACGDAPCPSRQDDIDAGRGFQTGSNVMIVVGAVCAAAGGGLILWSFLDDKDGDKATLTLGPGSMTVRGAF